ESRQNLRHVPQGDPGRQVCSKKRRPVWPRRSHGFGREPGPRTSTHRASRWKHSAGYLYELLHGHGIQLQPGPELISVSPVSDPPLFPKEKRAIKGPPYSKSKTFPVVRRPSKSI